MKKTLARLRALRHSLVAEPFTRAVLCMDGKPFDDQNTRVEV
jgi:hypothetical protein